MRPLSRSRAKSLASWRRGGRLALAIVLAALAMPATTQALTSSAADRTFHHWLVTHLGYTHGYYTCPAGQLSSSGVSCEAEFLVGATHHSVGAFVTPRGGATVTHPYDSHWIRRWSPYSRRVIAGFGTPGSASVNSPYFDWSFIASGIYYEGWRQHRRAFTVNGYDGKGTGLMRFFSFRCHRQNDVAYCANSFGDSIRFRR